MKSSGGQSSQALETVICPPVNKDRQLCKEKRLHHAADLGRPLQTLVQNHRSAQLDPLTWHCGGYASGKVRRFHPRCCRIVAADGCTMLRNDPAATEGIGPGPSFDAQSLPVAQSVPTSAKVPLKGLHVRQSPRPLSVWEHGRFCALAVLPVCGCAHRHQPQRCTPVGLELGA
eukprot:CAMPEP_0172891508 /NCGR_PEP_ID=MMETSP1075-20121228/144023_1 /TAXON_ID=2916 /ORGANISM="Ceratium fusus, Strain PA161109" /LENGTH=172 /DNA_ID=CAMNT_0013745987 /DNA_START=293 /DNA_END=812 /DNA_ORIENTATION=-